MVAILLDLILFNQGVELTTETDSEEYEGVLPTLALLMAGDVSGAIRRAQVGRAKEHSN